MPLSAMTGAPSEAEAQAAKELPKFLPERYEPVRLLGIGGMGAVYHCMDKQLDRPVAIKVMTDKFRSSPQGETRFMREARAQAIVNHRNVSTILNFGVSPEGKLFLVMEYLEGDDLRNYLRRNNGKIEPMHACEIMRQALEGLQEAHACGLVHRDIKPSNIMVIKDHRGQPWVKILDLGLAKMVGGQTDLMTITMDTANQLIGTPAYMSPEQVAGSKVDSRADIYSIGVVFYEMIAGRLPFESETLPGWLYQHLHETPEMPSRHNPELLKFENVEKVPMWMLAKKPEDRPQAAQEVVNALKNILAGKPIGDMIPLPRIETPPPEKPASANDTHRTPYPAPAPAPVAPSSLPRAEVKFSSVPAARPVPGMPGLPRRAFSSNPSRTGSSAPTVPPPGRGTVRQPPSGSPAAALTRLSNQPVLQRPAPGPTDTLVSSISGLDPEKAKRSYEQSCSEGRKAEIGGNWKNALIAWTRAQALAEMYGFETLPAIVENAKRQVAFEDAIAKSEAFAKNGDWQNADEILMQLSQPGELDARLEQAKAGLPRRLALAWMGLAAQRIKALPEGDFRRDLSERYTVACAASGDMTGAINFLDASPRRIEQRIVACAQAVSAAIRHGHTDGMRPYLERLTGDLNQVTNPAERGKASLEVGRAYAIYGDLEHAASSLRDSFRLFGDALSKNIPISVAERPQDLRSTRQSPIPSQILASGATKTGAAKSVRSSWLTAISALADAQGEAGLIDDCLKSAGAIDDPWTKALVLSQLVQNFTKAGRHELAERQAGVITFALPKTQALRAIAISKIYREDVTGAQELLNAIATPAERLPIYGVLAVYYGLRKDPSKPRMLIADLLNTSKQIAGALPRFSALCAAVEPMLSAGLNDMARTVFEEALQLVSLVDDPAERMRCFLHLAKLKEVRRDVAQSTTRTIAFSNRIASPLIDLLRQAMFTARQLRNGTDRLDCFESMSTRIAAAYLPILATEALNAFREEQDQAAIYLGLCTGMV